MIDSVEIDQMERRMDAQDVPQGDFLKGFKWGLSVGFVAIAVGLAVIISRGVGLVLDGDVTAKMECKRDREHAERYARLLTSVLNGNGLVVEGSTHVTCRAKQLEANS